MANVVRDLRERQVIGRKQGHWALAEALLAIERDLPESVRAMIERKIAQLSEEDRRLLAARPDILVLNPPRARPATTRTLT